MYRGIYDDLHRIILAPLTDVNQKPVYHQTGFTDKYILCYKWDNELLGGLEKYSSMILYGGKSKNPPVFERNKGLNGERSITIKNVDYNQFKRFILSILWRAHISTNKFFNKVNIFENELSIRKMLLSNTAGTEEIYKISIIGIKDNNENMVRALSDPEVKKFGDGYFATFFINGFVYFIDSNPPSDFILFKEHFLKETGKYKSQF